MEIHWHFGPFMNLKAKSVYEPVSIVKVPIFPRERRWRGWMIESGPVFAVQAAGANESRPKPKPLALPTPALTALTNLLGSFTRRIPSN